MAAVRAWRSSSPHGACYRLRRNDWAELPTGRFLFRSERRKRLIRIDAARWRPDVVVHEALSDETDVQNLPASIEHRFVTSFEDRGRRDELYALVWAVQTFGREGLEKGAAGRRPWHCFRNAVLKGALIRGGLPGLRLSWMTAGYHARKYHYLTQIAHGGFPLLVEAWRQGEYARLLQLAHEHLAMRSLAGTNHPLDDFARRQSKRTGEYLLPSAGAHR